MYIYILLYFILVTFLLKRESFGNRYVGHMSLLLVMIFLGFFVGFGDMLGGYDRYIYSELFDEIADITKNGSSYRDAQIYKLYSTEIGYIESNILFSYVTFNRYVFILLITLIIYILYFFSLKKYCINYSYAMMLFMGLMFCFTFTYLRQMIGVGFGWLAIQYMEKRKLIKFLFCILIAASFHNSAIILLPLYFIPVKRFKKQHVIIFMSLCLLLGLSGGPSAIFRLYGTMSDMQNRADTYTEQDIGFKYEYIIEALVFLYLILKNYTLIPNTKKDLVLLNTSLGFCSILLLFVLSLNGGRLGWFYLIGLIATLSTICHGARRNIIVKILVSLISFLLYVRIVFQWSFMLSPYKTFFTNGVRSFDPVYELYEYDENYAIDKFYR